MCGAKTDNAPEVAVTIGVVFPDLASILQVGNMASNCRAVLLQTQAHPVQTVSHWTGPDPLIHCALYANGQV
jgi:hypothetical protein